MNPNFSISKLQESGLLDFSTQIFLTIPSLYSDQPSLPPSRCCFDTSVSGIVFQLESIPQIPVLTRFRLNSALPPSLCCELFSPHSHPHNNRHQSGYNEQNSYSENPIVFRIGNYNHPILQSISIVTPPVLFNQFLISRNDNDASHLFPDLLDI